MENVSTCSTRAQHLKQQGAPVTKSFVIPPPNNNVEIEDKLKQMNNYVLHLYKNSVVPLNLNHNQAMGLKSLRMKKDSPHFSVSDKGGEFVVMEKPVQCELTEHHLTTSSGVYRYIPPARKYQGNMIQIATPTSVSYSRQIKNRTEKLQEAVNSLWREICDTRNFSPEIKRFFLSYHTQLPTLYVLLKTHKFDVNDITNNVEILQHCKARPIVSCCGSPTEKLAWLVTHILTPLLSHVPAHLRSTHEHLERLSSLNPVDLENKNFCSADISALYTNLNIEACIDDIMAMASEYKHSLSLLGLKLVDLHRILDTVLSNAYFTYNTKLYLQLVGLFMGCKVSPLSAIIRVYTFEKRVLYVDHHYISVPYGRYVDDAYTIASSLEESQ